MNMAIIDNIGQKGKVSKYRWLHAEIEKIKGTYKWLKVDELDSYKEVEKLRASAYKYYPGIKIRTRSYDVDGRLNPSISFRLD